jgi:hypothetical protein
MSSEFIPAGYLASITETDWDTLDGVELSDNSASILERLP